MKKLNIIKKYMICPFNKSSIAGADGLLLGHTKQY
jgi:hypothetical protein